MLRALARAGCCWSALVCDDFALSLALKVRSTKPLAHILLSFHLKLLLRIRCCFQILLFYVHYACAQYICKVYVYNLRRKNLLVVSNENSIISMLEHTVIGNGSESLKANTCF